jgi:DNA excision repair protein ERCC-4
MNLPAKLDPSNVIAIIDSREQAPLDLEPLTTITATLTTGDYSVRGLEHVVAIERKSLADLVGCVGGDRERFEREVQRLLAYPVRILVVESSWEAIESHEPAFPQWRGKVTREAVLGSLMGWQAAGLSVHMAGDHQRAGKHVARMLYTVARRRYAELRALSGGEP